jgi:hypothetical protein
LSLGCTFFPTNGLAWRVMSSLPYLSTSLFLAV